MNSWLSYIQAQLKDSRSRYLLGIGFLLLLVALLIGISDNLPGILLVYAGTLLLLLAFVHHLHEAAQFGTLLAISVVSFPVLTLLHNVFEVLHEKSGGIPVIDQLLQGFSVIFFLAAVFISPVGILIGAVLGLFYLIRSK